MANKSREYQFTQPVRHIWPKLFEPVPFIDPKTGKAKGDKKSYQDTFLLDPTSPDLAALKALAAEIAKEHNADFKQTAWPFKNGDKEIARLAKLGKTADYYKGQVFIRSETGEKMPPSLSINKSGVDFNKANIVDLKAPAQFTEYRNWFYSGSLVLPVLQLNWYDSVNGGLPGVKAYLNLVIATNTGERIGGGKTGSERFKSYAGTVVEGDPTAGMDDEIPF